MDRDTVRLLLLIVGVCVIAGIYLHGRFGSAFRRPRSRSDGLGELPGDWTAGEGSRVDAFVPDEEVEGVSRPWTAAGGVSPEDPPDASGAADGSPRGSQVSADSVVGAPFLIQASVVARPGETFSGEELRDALIDLGLVHGEMDIFHRYDRNFREPQFSVASLVKPGTFPMDRMDTFDCPGVVFFFQPTKVSDPLAVFDDLFETTRDLAEKLDGIEWDEHRQPLTDEGVRSLRDRVEEACG